MVSVSIAIRQYSGTAPKMDLFDQGRADYRASRQLIEQRLGVLQDRCVESFGEPAVDRREKIMRVVAAPTGRCRIRHNVIS